jgi:hypothetical protein
MDKFFPLMRIKSKTIITFKVISLACRICDRCGKNSEDIVFVENLPVYRPVIDEDGRKTLEYVGLDTHLCQECIEEYRADNIRLGSRVLNMAMGYDIA